MLGNELKTERVFAERHDLFFDILAVGGEFVAELSADIHCPVKGICVHSSAVSACFFLTISLNI